MDILVFIFACFSVLGILDSITGGHLTLGKEFEKGIMLMGVIIIAMLGMLCLAPVISLVISPVVKPIANFLHLDPSIFPSMILANDMGGASLSKELATDPEMGYFNGLAVSSMMGCTISFTIPAALRIIDKKYHPDALLGLLCGISTVPIGCIVSGLISGMNFLAMLWNLVPIIIFAGIIIFGLLKAPNFCVKVLGLFGKFITVLIMLGLALGIFQFLTEIEILPSLSPVSEHFESLFRIAFILSGTFPLLRALSLILKKPLGALAKILKINDTSVLGLVTSLASSAPTFDMVKEMDRKGIVLNLAFSVSAAFVISDHLAYTLMFNKDYALPVIAGKLASGVLSLFVANFIYNKKTAKEA